MISDHRLFAMRGIMGHFSIYQTLDAKKNGVELDSETIDTLIQQYTQENIADYQMSAFLMASFINGLSPAETKALTHSMLNSGKVIPPLGPNVIDKHSTGGVGDKASFILAPIAHACGVVVPMIAGRGLGHTGGTVDKVESIKGYNVELNLTQFQNLLTEHGIALIGQTPEIAPADRKIYALRDVTATIDSASLITASIMSKKLAEGASGFVFDIKVGNGAFMRTLEDANILAQNLVNCAKDFDRKASAIITNMDRPLGRFAGHAYEILESIETLQGRGPKDLTELSLELASEMIFLAGKAKERQEAMQMAQDSITSGKAFDSFRLMIKNQGGDLSMVEDPKKLPLAQEKTDFFLDASELKSMDTKSLGLKLIDLGGGRKEKTDHIDHGVAFEFRQKPGDPFDPKSPVITIHHHSQQKSLAAEMSKSFADDFNKLPPSESKLILKKVLGA